MKPAALIVVLLAALSAGCGGTTTIVKTVTTGTESAAAPAPKKAKADPPVNDARLGDTLSVQDSDTSLDVTAKAVLDPLPVGEYDAPSSGMRYVGIRLAVENTGDTAYADAVSNGSTLVLKGDEQADATIVSGGPCGSGFGSDVKIAPGDRRAGCIAFEVPAGVRLRSFQFTPSSGFADQTAEWRLPARAAGSAASDSPPATSGPSQDDTGSQSFTRCDANISAASGSTTCEFAQNAFYEYFVSGESSSISVYSPAAGTTLAADCSANGSQVVCESEDGGAARFAQSAIDAYSSEQARSYASSHRTGP